MVSRVVKVLIALAAAASISSPAIAQQAPSAKGPVVSGYHLVLLVADDAGAPGAGEKGTAAQVQGMTPAVARALKDVQQFLPFKNYRPVDSMLLRGQLGGQTRLKGPEGNLYSADVKTSVNGSEINVNLFIGLSSAERTITVLSTRFMMAPGETVVAGTSRLSSGGAAIVALLTAVTDAGTK